MNPRIIIQLIYIIIFFTGAAGLIYEVTWQKYLSRLLGSDTIATAIILAVFLGGLSLGYYLCGKISVYVRNHFKAYAVMEGIIGLWCMFFPQLFHGIESLTRSWSFAPPFLVILQGVICSSMLMGIPTICMGSTIPFLTRGISKNVAEATHTHARVYAINTAGAFLGTLLAGFYLIPAFGLPLTMMGTAFLNLVAFLAIYVLQKWIEPSSKDKPVPSYSRQPEVESSQQLAPISPWHLCSIAFLSGFYVMTLENALIRITNLSLGSSSYSFTLIISVFILSIAVGSYVVGRIKNLSRSILFRNQFFITLSLFIIYLTLDTWPYWTHLIRISIQSNPLGFWVFYAAIFQAMLVILGLPVALMGATVPITFHFIKRDLKNVGRHSGLLFSLNTIGSLSGSLIGGIVLYFFLDNGRVFLIAAVLAAVSTLIASFNTTRKHVGFSAAMIVIAFIFTIFGLSYNTHHFAIGTFRNRSPQKYSLKGPSEFFKKWHHDYDIKYYNDGPTATVAAIERDTVEGTEMSILVNGKNDSNTHGDIMTLKLSAHIPALLATQRKDIMLIGLGTGVTAGELSLYDDVERIDVAEISPSVVDALPLFSRFTHQVHNNSKVYIHETDAFRFLGRNSRKYDIVISEPSNPWVTGVDLLFTQEFYHIVQRHLKKRGMLLQWIHAYAANKEMIGMTVTTVKSVFKVCNVFIGSNGDLLILASDVALTKSDLKQANTVLANQPRVARSLKAINIENMETILMRQIWSDSYIEQALNHYRLQTMDHPRLHYIAGKRFFIGTRVPADFLLNSQTASYSKDYLFPSIVDNWYDFKIPETLSNSILRSMKLNTRGSPFPALKYVRFRLAYAKWKASGQNTDNSR
ncbi:MAG: spermine/spermidine synthase domain-containing protein, partial [Planctomycetota bacterium]